MCLGKYSLAPMKAQLFIAVLLKWIKYQRLGPGLSQNKGTSYKSFTLIGKTKQRTMTVWILGRHSSKWKVL